jgi:dihydrofolate reductase
MRKIAAFIMTSLDGMFDGPTPWDLDWHHVDDEFNDFATKQLDASGGLIFGRNTYQGMAQYWPTPLAEADSQAVASRMNSMPKFVISRTLDKPDPEWNHTQLIRRDPAGELAQLKEQPGRELLVLGSARLTASLMQMQLLDELRIIVNPVVLGMGRSFYEAGRPRSELKLLSNRTFKNGNVLLTYQPLPR